MRNKLPIAVILGISVVFFALGLIYPILSTKNSILGIVLDYKSVRLFDSVKIFWNEGDIILALVILVFTIIFPILKYIDLTIRFISKDVLPKKIVVILQNLDKWSMLDVFLVALLLINFKLDSNIVVMNLRIGTTFIAGSVIFRILASQLISKSNE